MSKNKNSLSNQFTLSEDLFLELDDLELCDECKMLGYCKEYQFNTIKEPNEFATEVQRNLCFDLNYYMAKIPFRVSTNECFSQYAKTHLQNAYDAFHVDDFETALLHFKAVEPGAANYSTSNYFLALTYFMLGNYEMSHLHMQICMDHTYYTNEDFTSFLDECSRLSSTSILGEDQFVDTRMLVNSK